MEQNYANVTLCIIIINQRESRKPMLILPSDGGHQSDMNTGYFFFTQPLTQPVVPAHESTHFRATGRYSEGEGGQVAMSGQVRVFRVSGWGSHRSL